MNVWKKQTGNGRFFYARHIAGWLVHPEGREYLFAAGRHRTAQA